ncbi:MAG: hypothetical protein JNK14_06620 [Chitinophagaceae bacterium]|nr:hypothetical protein [Chitinophagaceae bacterium]
MPRLIKTYPLEPVSYLLIVCVLLTSCGVQKQITVDPDLNNNSEKWKATVRNTVWAMTRSSFGPFRMTGYEKLDSPRLKNSSHKNISFHLFRREESFSQRKVYTLDVAGLSDTAHLLLFLWFRSKTSEPGFFSKKDNEVISATKDGYGEIITNKDTVPWQFRIESCDMSRYWHTEEMTKGACGHLCYKEDSLFITPVFTFTDSRYDHYPSGKKGVVLSDKNGKPVASLQLTDNNYVWIRKDLPDKTQLAIASLFAVMLGTKDL